MTTKLLFWYAPSVPIWIGDASAGRSATTPTFWRSTSVRTRIEWQNSQVVCTALDQRKVTGAPQLGQFAAGALMADRAAPLGGRPPLRLRIPSRVIPQNPHPAAAGNRRCSGREI